MLKKSLLTSCKNSFCHSTALKYPFPVAMAVLLKLYNKLSPLPMGKSIFSILFSMKAPYFLTIFPHVEDLKRGHAVISIKQKWIMQNHIKTVHAIAVCNLIEMAMGLMVSASIPDSLRWLPKGMDVRYLKKSEGKLTATTTVNPETIFNLESYPGDVSIPVEVRNESGTIVTSADVSEDCLRFS